MEEEEEVRAQAGDEHRDAVLQEDSLKVGGAPGRQALRENSSFFKQDILCLSKAYPGGSQGSVVSRGWPRWRQGQSRSRGGKWPGTTATTLEM